MILGCNFSPSVFWERVPRLHGNVHCVRRGEREGADEGGKRWEGGLKKPGA